MNVPSATYRIQLSSAFTFKDLRKIIPYLDRLGISTIYASPFFEARKGSTHGYDITNPLQINSEIGTLEELREINAELQKRKMSWLQDIVPNHMAFDSDNPWLRDVLELGPASRYYNFFDIDWHQSKKELDGKIMAPFFGDEPEKIIKKSQIKLVYEKMGFCFRYYEHHYPASRRSYPSILYQCLRILDKMHSKNSGVYKAVKELLEIIDEANAEDKWEQQKNTLRDLMREKEIAEAIAHTIAQINASPKRLIKILEQQYFKPAYWKTTESEINYRRFFTINDLICLRMEDEEVFNYYHQFIKQLYDEGLINGLRIDHIDGLFDPTSYLERLRDIIGDNGYLITEKILEWEERLPLQWPIQGTSGYVFLAFISNLFTSSTQKVKFSSAYHEVTKLPDYHDLIYEKKEFILQERMGGELSNLYGLMEQTHLLGDSGKHGRDKMITALTSFLAAFPVYRIYPTRFPLTYRQREVVMEAYETAISKQPKYKETLDHLLSIFMGEADKREDQMMYFLQRCQQFTGPLAAKGVEDTLFYIYNKLISHNEVGDSPQVFGISTEEFHENMRRRNLRFPYSVNATATHDTKRGEDARMRINVLSEFPEVWFANVAAWKQLNSNVRKHKKIPDDNEEYFIYQALIGAWPPDNGVDEEFLHRTQTYLGKVLREAKLHSNWSEPDEDYEQAVFKFIAAIFENQPFRRAFDPFCRKITFFGAINALGQTLIKITAPGIPDIYQGTELWDLSYVDPDNRRPVDYTQRLAYLETVVSNSGEDYIKELLQDYQDGRVKLFTLFCALKERRLHQEVFNEGKYLEIKASGKYGENIISYARRLGSSWYIIIAPKFLAARNAEGQYPVGEAVWEDAFLKLPEEAPDQWTNIFTGSSLAARSKMYINEALATFPIALLKATADDI